MTEKIMVDYCPICGVWVEDSKSLVAGSKNQHKCNQKTLNAIDAAHKRDDDEPHYTSFNVSLHERYKDGFGLFGRKKENMR